MWCLTQQLNVYLLRAKSCDLNPIFHGFLLICLVPCLGWHISLHAQQSLTISVVDAATTDPLPAATIYLTTEKDSPSPLISIYSDATGNATLTDLPPGTYSLTVTMLGYQPFEQPLKLTDATTTKIRQHCYLARST